MAVSLVELEEFMKNECENHMYLMCKIRTKELRNCALPRCCAICPEVRYCEGVCIILDEKFNIKGE